MMNFKLTYLEFKVFLFAAYVSLIFQLTDVTILSIKVSEILIFFTLPYVFKKVSLLNKFTVYFMFFFMGTTILTLILNPFRTFYIPQEVDSVLKMPYLITISRLVEFFCCIIFVIFTYSVFLEFNKKYLISPWFIVERILKVNFIIALAYIIEFILHKMVDLPNIFFYKSGEVLRLKGFYVEGGPLGLFYAYLAGISYLLPVKNKWSFITCFILVIIIAQSKAGYLFIVFLLGYILYSISKNNYIYKRIAPFFIVPLILLSIIFIGDQYIAEQKYIRQAVALRPDDNNLVMGRPAGIIITINMIRDNFLFGIGVGNYSLLRNDINYRDFIPETNLWDLNGFGGFYTVFIESGIIGIILYSIIILNIYYFYRRKSIYSERLLFLFITPILLSVQLYFAYFWFSLALLFAIKKIEE